MYLDDFDSQANRMISTLLSPPLPSKTYRVMRSPNINPPRRMSFEQRISPVLPSPRFNLDIQEKADGTIEIVADIPGFKRSEVNVEIDGNHLILSVEKTSEKQSAP
jgi:HSP20 family molecular chaperone IbpA